MLYISALIIPILLLPAPFRLSKQVLEGTFKRCANYGTFWAVQYEQSVFFYLKQGCQQRDGATKKLFQAHNNP